MCGGIPQISSVCNQTAKVPHTWLVLAQRFFSPEISEFKRRRYPVQGRGVFRRGLRGLEHPPQHVSFKLFIALKYTVAINLS